MLSAEEDAGFKRDNVQIRPDNLLYKKKWGQNNNTHKTSKNT